MKEDCFVKITNEEIYQRLVSIEGKIDSYKGKIKLNTWMASTALSLVVGLIFGYILKL